MTAMPAEDHAYGTLARIGLPVTGHAEWQKFCARPAKEQRRHVGPQVELINFIISEHDVDIPLPPLVGVCTKCKGVFFCECNLPAIIASSSQRDRSRSRKRAPPPPGMVAVQQLLGEANQEITQQFADTGKMNQDQHRHGKIPKGFADIGNPPPAPLFNSTSTHSLGASGPQKELIEVMALLPEKTWCMDRCRPVLQNAIEDLRISVWLSKDADITRHVDKVVGSLPTKMKFKIGITVDPEWRYYRASYAYTLATSKEKDGVQYEGMILVYVHPVRDVVGAFETCLIDKYQIDIVHKSRTANIKRDFDGHLRYDHSDEETEHGPGPHFLYIVYGQPGPRWRSNEPARKRRRVC
jgi:hypothetical protein